MTSTRPPRDDTWPLASLAFAVYGTVVTTGRAVWAAATGHTALVEAAAALVGVVATVACLRAARNVRDHNREG